MSASDPKRTSRPVPRPASTRYDSPGSSLNPCPGTKLKMPAELMITERLADLLMLSHEPMFAWKLDGAIEFWNAGAERLYGFAANEAVGHSSHSLLKTKHP